MNSTKGNKEQSESWRSVSKLHTAKAISILDNNECRRKAVYKCIYCIIALYLQINCCITVESYFVFTAITTTTKTTTKVSMCYTVASKCRMKIARSLFSCNSGKLIKTFVQKFSILYVRFFKHFYWNTHKIKMKCFQVHCFIPEHIVPRLLLQQCLI